MLKFISPGPRCWKAGYRQPGGKILDPISFSFVQKHFLWHYFFTIFGGTIMLTEGIAKLKLPFRLSYLNSNFALTGLVILINPVLNKPSGPAGCDPRL